MLELFVGSSSVSIGVLLGTFMGGMCLGQLSAAAVYLAAASSAARCMRCSRSAIGVIGLLLMFVLPLVGHVYTAWGGYGITGYLLRGLVASVCLLPPTLAMGATLPAVARWVQTTPTGVSWLGFFYAGNIAGAVMGTLLAGFYLLRVFDMNTATYVAAAINFAVGALGLLVAARTRSDQRGVEDSRAESPIPDPQSRYKAVGRQSARCMSRSRLSGFCALAAQVIWTRLLSLLFGASTYTFSLILAVFLIGLGIGSSLGSIIAKSVERPRVALGWCQLLNVGAMAWSAYMLMESLPYWPINTSITTSIWYNFQLDFVRALWAVLPGPILCGGELSAGARGGCAPGRRSRAARRRGVCRQHCWRHLRLGDRQPDSRLLVRIAAGAAGLDDRLGHVGPAAARSCRARRRRPERERTLRWVAPAALIVALGFAAFLIRTVPTIPGILVAYGRYAATWLGQEGDIFYVGEGLSSSVAVSRFGGGDELSQRRQSAGLEPAAGHAAAAHARAFHDARAENPEEGAGDRLRRRRDGRGGEHRPARRSAHHRRNRAARAARRVGAFRRAQFPCRPKPQDAHRHRRCAALSADDRRESSTRSRPIRSIRG